MIFSMMKEIFLIGAFSFGGGLVVIPFFKELQEATTWYTMEELNSMISISEMIPGPLATNMSTYIGYQLYGILGGIIATVIFIIPAIIFMTILYKIYSKYKENKLMKTIFKYIRPTAMALIIISTIEILKIILLKGQNPEESLYNILNYKTILLGIAIYCLMKKFKLHPIIYMVLCAIFGIVINISC